MLSVQLCNYTVKQDEYVYNKDFPSIQHFFFLVESYLGESYSSLAYDQYSHNSCGLIVFVKKCDLPFYSVVEVKKIVKKRMTRKAEGLLKGLGNKITDKVKCKIFILFFLFLLFHIYYLLFIIFIYFNLLFFLFFIYFIFYFIFYFFYFHIYFFYF